MWLTDSLMLDYKTIANFHKGNQLAPMATAAKEVLARDEMHVLADKGDFSSREILTCLDAGITTTVPHPRRQATAARACM